MSNTFTLSEIANVVDCEHKTASTVDSSEYYSIRTTDISNGRINFDNANRVSLETYLEWTRRAIPQAGDLILAREAPVGEVGYIKKGHKVCLGQRTVLIQVTSNLVDNRYLLYYLTNPETRHDLQVRSAGSVVAHLNMKDIRAFEVVVPPLNEQKAITAVLSSLDDKIDLLHRQNKTLESLAQTLFRHWFVDKAEDFVKLTELVEINPAMGMRKGTVAPYLEMKNVQTDSCTPIDWYDREYNSGTRFQNGDTLMARITPCLENNKVSFVNFLKDGGVGWGSTEFLVLRAKKRLPKFYTYLLAKDPDFRSFAIKTMTGSSGRQRVQTESLYNYELGEPSERNLAVFTSQVVIIEQRLKLNANQIRTLEKLRDTLLPKLMSGEVRVRQN